MINKFIKLFLLLFNRLEQNVLRKGNCVRYAAFLKRDVQAGCPYRTISPPPEAGVINKFIKSFLFLFNRLEQNVLRKGDGVRYAAFLKRDVQVRRLTERYRPRRRRG